MRPQFAQAQEAFVPSSDAINISVADALAGGERALELSYNYDPRLITSSGADPLAAANLFFITIQTDAQTYRRTVIMQDGAHSVYLYPFMFDGAITSLAVEAAPELIDLYGSTQRALNLQVRAMPVEDIRAASLGALPASLDDMLHAAPSRFTRFGVSSETEGTVFRWSAHPYAVVFLFSSHEVQDEYLKRITLFVEKKGTRGELLSGARLASRSGWGANDYKADDLATFFETARTQGVELNARELELKRMLMGFGILAAQNEAASIESVSVRAGEGVIGTVSRAYGAGVQEVLLGHELMHAWFFEDENMREAVRRAWDETSPELRARWRGFLEGMGYDDGFEYLAQNEFFAYLEQRPIETLTTYVPAWFGRSVPPARAAELTDEMIAAARAIEAYIRAAYNAQSGRVKYIFSF